MQLVLERRAERSTPIAVASPLIAFALTIVTPTEESLLTVNHRLRREDSMRLPGAVGIDFRDRRGVRRGASEILTSLMLVYVANLGMDYVVCGPGAIAISPPRPTTWSSEERTTLLNHCLTEMSEIALAHGATIDKYMATRSWHFSAIRRPEASRKTP